MALKQPHEELLCHICASPSALWQPHGSLAKNLCRRWPALWTFASLPRIEPTTSDAGRGLALGDAQLGNALTDELSDRGRATDTPLPPLRVFAQSSSSVELLRSVQISTGAECPVFTRH